MMSWTANCQIGEKVDSLKISYEELAFFLQADVCCTFNDSIIVFKDSIIASKDGVIVAQKDYIIKSEKKRKRNAIIGGGVSGGALIVGFIVGLLVK